MSDHPFRFCPRCGADGLHNSRHQRFTCASCSRHFYVNEASAVGVLLVDGPRVLIVRRARDPGKGLLDLPGGFVNPGESLEQALHREVDEELGIGASQVTYLCSAPNHYLHDGVPYRTTDCYFLAVATGVPVAADDVAEVMWVHRDDIDLEAFAFESTRQAVRTWISR